MKYFENMLQPGFETGGSNPGHVSDGNVICRWFQGTYDDDGDDDDDDYDGDEKDVEKMTRKMMMVMMVMTLLMVTVMMVMKMLILVFLMGTSFANDCMEHITFLSLLLQF